MPPSWRSCLDDHAVSFAFTMQAATSVQLPTTSTMHMRQPPNWYARPPGNKIDIDVPVLRRLKNGLPFLAVMGLLLIIRFSNF